MALAEDADERAATAGVFREIKAKIRELEARLEKQTRPTSYPSREEQIGSAMAVLGNLSGLAERPEDHAAIGELFARLNVQMYLIFRQIDRGRRRVNQLSGGILTFGSTPPPGPLYDGPTYKAIIRQRLAVGEPVSVGSANASLNQCASPSVPEVNWSANVHRGTTKLSGPTRPSDIQLYQSHRDR